MDSIHSGWKIKALKALLLLACSAGILIANSAGPPLAHTGDFGEPSCIACHTGNQLNASGGSLTITGVPVQYATGQTYTITVTINRTTQRKWGFELAVRDLAGKQAGNLVATNTLLTAVESQSGIQYIHHTFNGTFPGIAGPQSWMFNWIAPTSNVGIVRFGCAGNAANSNAAETGDFIYTTTATSNAPTPSFSLYYPRLVTTDGTTTNPDNSEYTGIAVANLDTADATLTFTAFDKTGAKISGTSITNPASQTLSKGAQLATIDFQVFGSGLTSKKPLGWMKLESTVKKIVGFFLIFNGSLSILDGADVSSNTLTSFALPEIEDQGFTQIHIANPDASSATITLDLVKSEGTTRSSATRTVNSNGAVGEFITDLFSTITADSSDYIRVTSTKGVVPFEYLGKTGQYVEGLNGQDATAGASTLYCPQYVVGGSPAFYRTTLSVVNLDSTIGTVTFKFIKEDGTQIGTTQTKSIAAKGKIYITDQKFFLDAGSTLTQGYVIITSSGPKLAGSVVFGDPARNTFSAALPLVSTLQTSVIFSQIASGNVGGASYFTGLALVNPNTTDANATIQVFDKNGVQLRTTNRTIKSNQRVSQLLTQYFTDLTQDIGSGYIKVTIDQGVASFALYGTSSLSVLSAVPPQVIP